MEQITKTFKSNAASKSDAAKDIANQIMQEVFGITLIDGKAIYMNRIKIEMDVSSNSYQYIHWYINSTSNRMYYSLDLQYDRIEYYYMSVTWIKSTYLAKLGDLYIWKGKYTYHNSDTTRNQYLMDLETGEYYVGSIKALKSELGMAAIVPLYEKGKIIEDAYMCRCSNMTAKHIYYVGGRPFMYLNGSVIIALEP